MPWLHEMKWPAVKEYLTRRALILLPVGSTEQHGRHAPLGTDTFVAARLAEDASRRTSTLCAPPLHFGWSPHHLALPGTISIEPSVLASLLFQVIQSLARHGFKSFIAINGHRITNLPWIQIAAEKAQNELGIRIAIFDPAYMQKEFVSRIHGGAIGHAEELETSELLYLMPDLVDLGQAVDTQESDRPLFHVDPRDPGDTLCYVPSSAPQMNKIIETTGGSTGQPTKATTELGQRLHEHLVNRLVEVIDTM